MEIKVDITHQNLYAKFIIFTKFNQLEYVAVMTLEEHEGWEIGKRVLEVN